MATKQRQSNFYQQCRFCNFGIERNQGIFALKSMKVNIEVQQAKRNANGIDEQLQMLDYEKRQNAE